MEGERPREPYIFASREKPLPERAGIGVIGGMKISCPLGSVVIRVAGFLLGVGLAGADSVPSSAWPVFRGDPALSGFAPAAPNPPLRKAWTFTCAGAVQATPISDGELIWIGSLDGHLYALDAATGSNRWRYPAGDAIEAPALLAAPHLLVVGTRKGEVHAVDPRSGEPRWIFTASAKITAAPARDAAGRILVGSFDARLHALDPQTGTSLWTYACDSYLNGTPAVEGERAVFGSCDGRLRHIRTDTGALIREVDLESYIPANPLLARARAVAGTVANGVWCWDLSTGGRLWQYAPSNTQWMAAPATDGDLLVIGAQNRTLHALALEDGRPRWVHPARAGFLGAPLLTPAVVIAADERGHLLILDRATGRTRWSYSLGADVHGAPALIAGRLVIGTEEGTVWAFESIPPSPAGP